MNTTLRLSALILVMCLGGCAIETPQFKASDFGWALGFLYICAQLALLLALLLAAGSVFAGFVYLVFRGPRAVRTWLSKKYPGRFSPPEEEEAPKAVPSYRILRHEVSGRVLYEPQWWNQEHQVTHTREVNYPDEPIRTETYTVPAPRWEPVVEKTADLPATLAEAGTLIEAHSLSKTSEQYWRPRTLDGNILKPRDSKDEVVVEIPQPPHLRPKKQINK